MTWSETSHWRTSLLHVLAGQIGGRADSYVYLVEHGEAILYVGHTTDAIIDALERHIAEQTLLGRELASATSSLDAYHVETARIEGDLAAAARYYQALHTPALNDPLPPNVEVVAGDVLPVQLWPAQENHDSLESRGSLFAEGQAAMERLIAKARHQERQRRLGHGPGSEARRKSSPHTPTLTAPTFPPSPGSDDPFFDAVPQPQRFYLLNYLRGNKESDQDEARNRCETFGLDYDEAWRRANRYG